SDDVKAGNFGVIISDGELVSREFSDDHCREIYELMCQRKNRDQEYLTGCRDYCRNNLLWDHYGDKLVMKYWQMLKLKV
ncbi:MAG: hypothetical protein IKD22_01490, partial [Lentisphaeria bacterium]|nr:hypothetical protein [Lentisphaeria bacterium]